MSEDVPVDQYKNETCDKEGHDWTPWVPPQSQFMMSMGYACSRCGIPEYEYKRRRREAASNRQPGWAGNGP
jgi:hypothetical protein